MRSRLVLSFPTLSLIAIVSCSNGGGGAGIDSDVMFDGGADVTSVSDTSRSDSTTAIDGAIVETLACKATGGSAAVAAPKHVRNIAVGETAWFSSPAVVDLDHDGQKEIVAPLYSTFVFDASGKQLAKATSTKGRVYAPAVVADLDGDSVLEVVVGGNEGTVVAYEYRGKTLLPKTGWTTTTTCSAGLCPEARGLAAGDLDGVGGLEVVFTTTQTQPTGAQVFAFTSSGRAFQPGGIGFTAWPRYNVVAGTGNDLDFNGPGNHGYGCYGENVGLGNVDDDSQLEVIVTYDNHHINVFNHDGTSVLTSSWYTNRDSKYAGNRFGYGQFIRWFDEKIEDDHYHLHTGDWPDVNKTMWLQWTASPPNVVDLDGDGKNELLGFPNAELKEPYETQGYALMVLDGAHDGGVRAGRRHEGFGALPFSDKPIVRADDDWYPPSGIPAPTTVSIVGDARPEIIAPLNDGFIYAIGPDGRRLFRFDYTAGVPKTFASEVVVADLNQDGAPELVFGTYALGESSGRIVVLDNTGRLLHDVRLPAQGKNGNGIGVAAAPTIADLDGDGTLEIVVATFDHGLDVFTVPGSGTGCLLWPTGRGNLLRDGRGPSTAK
jgi:hypothetical protein